MKLVIAGEPRPKQRPRVVKGAAYTPKRTTEAEDAIGWAWREAGYEKIDGRIHLRLTFRCKAKRHTDLDNLIKLVSDGLNGIAYEDDWQVDSIDAERIWVDSDPCTEVVVTER